jgi:hypothetical protein
MEISGPEPGINDDVGIFIEGGGQEKGHSNRFLRHGSQRGGGGSCFPEGFVQYVHSVTVLIIKFPLAAKLLQAHT